MGFERVHRNDENWVYQDKLLIPQGVEPEKKWSALSVVYYRARDEAVGFEKADRKDRKECHLIHKPAWPSVSQAEIVSRCW